MGISLLTLFWFWFWFCFCFWFWFFACFHSGWGFVTIYQGQQTTVGGTSASAPAVGAVLALVNNYRKAHGKGTLGFANPTFYQNSWAWTDVTAGSASGCDDSSDYKFPATSGWDAASGLGLPNLQQLFKLP